MAQKKAGGSTRNGRDSASKRLGIKCFGGQVVKSGFIILRQRGTAYHPGKNVGKGSDDTLYAKKNGRVKYSLKGYKQRRTVEIV
jgi:large subunit ribosomal protein L27